jgi:hypothetical protein
MEEEQIWKGKLTWDRIQSELCVLLFSVVDVGIAELENVAES